MDTVIHESYSNETVNSTKPTSQFKETNKVALALLFSLAAAIVVINSSVFYLFFKKKALRTTSNYPLFSLAVCDFFCGFIIIPLFAFLFLTPLIQPSGSITFYLGFVSTVLHNFVAIATVYHIVVVTGERYLAIKAPFKHRVLQKKSILIVLIIVWLSSLVVSFLPFTWLSRIYPVPKPESSSYALSFSIFCIVFALILPYIFLVYAFIDMFKGINGRSKSLHRKESGGVLMIRRPTSFRNQSSSERKSLALFAIMASVYLICWFPWFVVFLLHQLSIDSSKLLLPSQVSLIVRYATSVANPLLYTFMKRDFFQAFKFVFSRHRGSAVSLPGLRGQQTSKEVGSSVVECREHLYESAC
ncbi:histamine H2 receptor-like [Stylophora pistillata]|uniref:histamine H2 receptor-like n=1 Tax=Stylophora pistillata TaxID=50429 RepID=UPI000C0516FE|nr:histamine H2 receptor-like [Stylophora pistillata]XP_022798125.1 histamine H2 receptor-like [Stylophora pistillata]